MLAPTAHAPARGRHLPPLAHDLAGSLHYSIVRAVIVHARERSMHARAHQPGAERRAAAVTAAAAVATASSSPGGG